MRGGQTGFLARIQNDPRSARRGICRTVLQPVHSTFKVKDITGLERGDVIQRPVRRFGKRQNLTGRILEVIVRNDDRFARGIINLEITDPVPYPVAIKISALEFFGKVRAAIDDTA